MKQKVNIHAQHYAECVHGTFETYLGMHMVTYDYGSSPSLAIWQGRQHTCLRNIHFLNDCIRTSYIEQLKKRQRKSHLFRLALRLGRRNPAPANAMA